jgi:outer membrane protein assembly factor BamB
MRTLMTVFLLTLSATPTLANENWPQFRGPNGAGLSDSTGLPTKWDEKTNVVWKTRIHGKGWSSPVIWGKQIWLTTATVDGKALYAICVDKDNGKVLRDLKVFENPKPPYTSIDFNSHASPTPVIEEGRVYVHFGSSGTACLDTKTGKVLWTRRDLLCEHWRGPGSSPIFWEDLLILTFDGYDRQYLVALRKKDGKTAWKKDRSIDYRTDDGDLKKAYSTPVVIRVNGKLQLVSPSARGAVAYEPRTGKEVWKVHHEGMNAAHPPLYGFGKVFLTTGHTKKLLAVRPDGTGDVTETHVDWEYGKAVPTRPAPLLVGERLFMVSDDGVSSCLHAKTGKPAWPKALRLGRAFSSSPVYAGGHVYCCDQEGTAYVVDPAGKGKLAATNKLDAGCMATPAVSGKALYVRTKTHLYRIEKK